MTPERLRLAQQDGSWDRFWSKVDATGDCWEWTAGKTTAGYGTLWFWRNGKAVCGMAHRLAWEALVGLIPDGLHIDHLCRNRGCVNPDHLEPVTQAENNRRGAAGAINRNRMLAQTHCKRGHPLSGTNLGTHGNRSVRSCLACRRDRYRAKRERLCPTT